MSHDSCCYKCDFDVWDGGTGVGGEIERVVYGLRGAEDFGVSAVGICSGEIGECGVIWVIVDLWCGVTGAWEAEELRTVVYGCVGGEDLGFVRYV